MVGGLLDMLGLEFKLSLINQIFSFIFGVRINSECTLDIR